MSETSRKRNSFFSNKFFSQKFPPDKYNAVSTTLPKKIVPKGAKNCSESSLETKFSAICSSGHVECSFDSIVESLRVKAFFSAQCPRKMKNQFFLKRKRSPQKFSLDM